MRHPLYSAAYQAARNLVRLHADLGFDDPSQALIAIVQHGDWQDRWEVEGPDAVAVLEIFRAAHLQFFPHWGRLLLTLADGSRAARHPEYREAV